MYIVHVAVQVKENKIDTFVDVVEDNRKNSLIEEGVLQFDVFQDTEQKNHFLLIEVYQTQEDQLKHRETSHFARFKEAVPDLLEKPYSITIYDQVFN
ncbi:putative quinol monooxygenase [Salipaludibacillus sp. CF4.18]|uniref:putative quinol monooxygenase n=1 Tax=Salipaludibacillus sp. CF4.18 TaxID=3373081 RepID=UPI003EE5D5C0